MGDLKDKANAAYKAAEDELEGFWNRNKVGLIAGASVVVGLGLFLWWAIG